MKKFDVWKHTNGDINSVFLDGAMPASESETITYLKQCLSDICDRYDEMSKENSRLQEHIQACWDILTTRTLR